MHSIQVYEITTIKFRTRLEKTMIELTKSLDYNFENFTNIKTLYINAALKVKYGCKSSDKNVCVDTKMKFSIGALLTMMLRTSYNIANHQKCRVTENQNILKRGKKAKMQMLKRTI